MSESKFEILTSTESVIGKLKKYLELKNIEKIEVYCSDFENYEEMYSSCQHTKTLLPLSAQIYEALFNFVNNKKNHQLVQVYSNRSFTQENFTDLLNNHKNKKIGEKKRPFFSKKGISTQDQESIQTLLADYLCPIAQRAKSNIKKYIQEDPIYILFGQDQTYKHFVIDNGDFSSLSELTRLFLKYSQNQKEDFNFLINQLDTLKSKLIELLQNILDKEGIEKDVNSSINQEFDNFIENIKNINNQGRAPIIKMGIIFLIQALPALVEIVSTRGFSVSWIDLAKSIQNFAVDTFDFINNQYVYSYMLPLYRLLVQDIAPAFALLGQKNLNNIIYIHTENNVYFIDYSHYNPFVLELNIFSHFGYAICGSNFLLGQGFSSPNFSLQAFNKGEVRPKFEEMFALNNPRISLFTSPYFNSNILLELIKKDEKSVSKEGRNYLVLSQCPTKSNAGLSEWLIQKLGYEIKDSINRTSQPPKLTQKPKKHNPIVDYSKYEIQINANDNQPFVLSLSPFGLIPSDKYNTLLQNKAKKDAQQSVLISIELTDDVQIEELRYIESFFQTSEKLDEYLKKDKKLFEDEVGLMQGFLDSLGHIEKKGSAYSQRYQAHELILITLLIFAIQSSYDDVFIGETNINFEGEILRCGKQFIQTSEGFFLEEVSVSKVYNDFFLSFSSTNQSNKFSIAPLIKSLEQNNKIDTKKIFRKIARLCNVVDETDYFGFFYLAHINLCIQIFPFASILSHIPNLDLKILNAILSDKKSEILITDLNTYFNIKEKFTSNLREIKESKQVLREIVDRFEKNKESIPNNPPPSFSQFLLDEIKKYSGNVVLQSLKNLFEGKPALRRIFNVDIKGLFISSLQALAIYKINESWMIDYEKQKRKYEYLVYSKMTDKNNSPLAIKREEGVYYPIAIDQTSLSFSFQNIILGGRFCTGGLLETKGTFYKICETQSIHLKNINTQGNPNIIRKCQLNMFFALLCLDELRGKTIGEKAEDQDFFKQNHSEKEFINYILNTENKTHKAIYKSYGGGSKKKAKSQGEVIKSYQVIMQYFSDIQTGAFYCDTKKNTQKPKKHREAIRALDNIGKNNIRGLYVGISEKKDREKRPKLIGRLATTIIMKDGLWIG